MQEAEYIVMDGERMKRKLENEEEESEEEKLEKFYALIRSTKDAHDRLANAKDNKSDKKDDFTERGKGVWKPAFQPEDFTDDYQQAFRCTHQSSNQSAPSPSGSTKHDDVVQVADEQPPRATATAPPLQMGDDERANDRLDLNLSL
ncbi:uncharacterized protein LOC129304542 [Prosopis cineraria]|uniref:uncharacterized protein LOC129304542 n=1 Tax=Prosopis cineraria TaxID=364024 RepID=UPI00240F91F6|nr:uncharacterized protein LOC129304542 [Prosopis cineraria]